MAGSKFVKELKAIEAMLNALEPLDATERDFAIKTVVGRLGLAIDMGKPDPGKPDPGKPDPGKPAATKPDVQKPSLFLAGKRPQLDIERVACLAYLLKHTKDLAAFKTLDITKLNTEAAGRDLSNTSAIARNAVRAGYLAKAGGGKKQITPLGELVVEALPDQDAVKKIVADHKPKQRRARKRKGAKKP
jgi:hypothetical protein